MFLQILISVFISASAVSAEEPQLCPSCILVNTTCYNVSHVLDLDVPFRQRVVIPKMGILRSKNILYFSFEPMFEDPEYYKIGFVNLEDVVSKGVISGEQVLNLGTFDIDQDNNLIYFGGSDGIFVLDTNINKIAFYSSRGDTIANIFYKNKVYFSMTYGKGIVVKNGDYFTTKYEDVQVNNFVITKYDVFVYLNSSGLHISKGEVTHRLSINPFFRGITIDIDGTVYVWWIDGIYKVVIKKNLTHSKLVKVASIPNIGAMTFDNSNNLLFTVDKSLYVMKETNEGCEVAED